MPQQIPAPFRDFSVKTAISFACDGNADHQKKSHDQVGHGAPVFNAINAIVFEIYGSCTGDNAGSLYPCSLRPQSRSHTGIQLRYCVLLDARSKILKISRCDLTTGPIDYLLALETRERKLFGRAGARCASLAPREIVRIVH